MYSFSVAETFDETTGDKLTEEVAKTTEALDETNLGFDLASSNQSTEALNGTNVTYDNRGTEMKMKKNVSKLTVVVDPRGMLCPFS